MPIYLAGSLIDQQRKRIGLEREIILQSCNIEERTLARYLNNKQYPNKARLATIIEQIGLQLEGLVSPSIDIIGMEGCILCDQLSQALERGDINVANGILDRLEALPEFHKGIFNQYRLSKRAHLWYLMDKPSSMIYRITDEAMKVTYAKYNEDDDGDVTFLFEEPELQHTKARVYMRDGNMDAAIRILERMRSSYIRMPSTDKEKKRLYAPVLLSLAECLLETNDYSRTMEVCETGAAFSAQRMQGRLNPDFELIIAHALRGLGNINECRAHIQHAYFGFSLLGETVRARDVLAQANDQFNISFDTYGVDKLDFSLQLRVPYDRGEVVDCNSIGSMIETFRSREWLSREQLCSGICDKAFFANIAGNTSSTQIFTLEAILLYTPMLVA